MSADMSAVPPDVTIPQEADSQQSRVINLRSVGRFRFDVAFVGLGYVGLPTALAFHAARRQVLGFDLSSERLAAIEAERVDLLDSDRERLHRALGKDDFTLTDDVGSLAEAQAVIIAVPTPVDEYQLPDLAILRNACASVVANAVLGQIIILTSTSYVGSTQEMLVAPLAARGFTIGEDIHVAFSPERIDPGNDRHAHEDVARVVGGATPECTRAAMDALGAYVVNLFSVSSTEVAEMTKLFENTFRAVNIALANELAEISRALKIDVAEVVTAAATKPFGFMAFMPGPGVGGHCIPCDPHYLLWQLRRKRLATPIIEQTMQSIASRPLRVVDRVTEVLSLAGRGIKGARVLVLGVAYKPDVQDVRESPAIEIITGLRTLGATVDFHDPLVEVLRLPGGEPMKSVVDPRQYYADLVLVHTLHQCLDLSWLEDAPLILDTSYRLRELPQRFTL
jgi:UDP-N-acetyl-D-glucosamine dehydrogenase